jgi:TolB protein
VRITRGVRDLSGDALQDDEETSFTTAAPPPLVPASAQIAFTSTRGGDSAIYVMNADGSGVTRNMRGSRAVWSPDGSHLAIVASGELESQDIYVVGTDGATFARIVAGRRDEREPTWSPDGRSIAYRRTNPLSPDGGYIGYRDGGSTIVISSADGSGITGSLGGGSYPAWSPDGGRMAYVMMPGIWVELTGTPFTRCERLFVSDVSYTSAVALTPGGDTQCATTPAWSPDGSRIVFSEAQVRGGGRDELTGFSLFPSNLFSINADGSGLTALTASVGDDYAPAWSPDGSRLAFTSTRDGRAQIYVMSADGTGTTNISANDYDDSYPSWRAPR